VCDVAESCDGTRNDCPGDGFRPSTFVCHAAEGPCDIAEQCTGSAAECPGDVVKGAGEVCRSARSYCDVPEMCDGTTVTCPINRWMPSGTACPDDGNICTNDWCDAEGYCEHPANGQSTCDDGDPCTIDDTCSESGGCSGTKVCELTCRSAGFWGTHGGSGGSSVRRRRRLGLLQQGDITGAVIAGAPGGMLAVCGQTIDRSVPIGDLDSALEALCVADRGKQVRQLYRQLVAFKLNCVLSGEAEDCDFILPTASACDTICAGESVEGLTMGDCVEQLECFNTGGRFVPGIGCARGVCEDEPFRLCGGAFDGCPSICTARDPFTLACTQTKSQACVSAPGNCHERDLCPADTTGDGVPDGAGFCFEPTGPAMSKTTCHRARMNQCTIDLCR